MHYFQRARELVIELIEQKEMEASLYVYRHVLHMPLPSEFFIHSKIECLIFH